MTAMRGPRLQVASGPWIAEERASALQIVQDEVEEFSYSARNELDWLNEHMAGIFSENETNLAETFKTPGKLRGKTPQTVRKAPTSESRVPLSDVFASTPNGYASVESTQTKSIQSPIFPAHLVGKSSIPLKSTFARKNAFSPGLSSSLRSTPGSSNHDNLKRGLVTVHADPDVPKDHPTSTETIDSPEKTFQTAREEQTTRIVVDKTTIPPLPRQADAFQNSSQACENPPTPLSRPVVAQQPAVDAAHPDKSSRISPTQQSGDDTRSASDGSSPLRPIVRKSSLNFASLPAREPLATGKSIGARVSRTSQLDPSRPSHYGRRTEGKSIGNAARLDQEKIGYDTKMDIDENPSATCPEEKTKAAVNYTKAYTQRLQDQINLLGKTQPISSGHPRPKSTTQAPQPPRKSPSPVKNVAIQSTPGAFPEDDENDEDDWIEPPTAGCDAGDVAQNLLKSHSADVMEGIQEKLLMDQTSFSKPKSSHDRDLGGADQTGPYSGAHDFGPSSVLTLPASLSAMENETQPLKPVSVSNPNLRQVYESGRSEIPSKFPSRNFLRDSPLKQVKNKLSSILKSSKGLLASSAALSAEGKSFMTLSTAQLHHDPTTSTDDAAPDAKMEPSSGLDAMAAAPPSPDRPIARRTRSSTEKAKDEKRHAEEAKSTEEQSLKLERVREIERQRERVFDSERARTEAMEKRIAYSKGEETAKAKETPGPSRHSPRGVTDKGRSSPNGDVDMTDAASIAPAPSTTRPVGPGQTVRKEVRRPTKPTKEPQFKAKQAPTVIKVNTGSQHSQYHPSSRISTASHDTGSLFSSQSQHQGMSSSNRATLQSSTQSLRSGTGGRPRAMDTAAKKKEQEEREARRVRDAKRAEAERQRAMGLSEQRKQERRAEAGWQKQQERAQAAASAEGKVSAHKKTAPEKAKQTRAPPAAVRGQPSGTADSGTSQDKSLAAGSSVRARPQSQMGSSFIRPQEEQSRPVKAILATASKAGTKRGPEPERGDDRQVKHGPSRAGPGYAANDVKRRRTSDGPKNEAEVDNSRNIKGPPVRPSGGFKKDLPAKPMGGFANASHGSRDLFKATLTAQHNHSQMKASHPLDMAQISKGAIPFAPNPNAGGTTSKTPARSGAANGGKPPATTATRSSPRFQNGESIELPEIQTDDEDDEDEDSKATNTASWADSPDLRRALVRQETMDPSQIFGPPAPLNMEEVFNKSKDRWHKFRARTSSANWSGADRLTEDDIRKDLAARDKLRRDGGWSYEMSRDVL